jgi:hypothetical protein
MNIDPSTMNAVLAPVITVLLGGVVALQAWQIREIFKIKSRVSIIISHCRRCPQLESDTDRIVKLKTH